MAAARKDFAVYLATGEIRSVSAPNLRQAINLAEKEAAGAEIVAALESALLPAPGSAALPFHVVLLRNPAFASVA